jgi:hypothetical protein
MTEAMNNTIDALGRKAIDSSQEAIERASDLILKLRGNEDPAARLSQSGKEKRSIG